MQANVKARTSLTIEPTSLCPTTPVRAGCARAVLFLALALLAATFFLISPQPGKTYPGAIPWGNLSVLRPLTDLMSLNGLLATVRGVEVKDLALHLAATLGLVLLGVSQLAPAARVRWRAAGSVAFAQILLAGWVLLSLLSSLWSGEPELSRGQAALYALSLGWAVALAHTFDRRYLRHVLYGALTISALGAALCVWYYYERNPNHRPGFPLGNPTTLAAAILPGVLIAVAVVCGAARDFWRARQARSAWLVLGALVTLVPLTCCLALTRGRGAMLALAAGGAAMVVFLVSHRLRWVLASLFVLGIAGAGGWLFYTSSLDVTMARGPAMRFRVYAWRYAADFWQANAILGNGAGSYPRLAGQLAVNDRALDPAAFMGEIVEHAHNELFEVLAEIGLVGGVTFVGGLLATGVAATTALRRKPAGFERWLLLGLVGSMVAGLADSMAGVTLRLPGGPAVYFTLLGVLWAVCRSEGPRSAEPLRPPGAMAVLTCAVCIMAAAGAGWLTLRNWSGVLREEAANVAFEERRYAQALDQVFEAEPRLLDPVRKITARHLALQCRFALAHQALTAWAESPTSVPGNDRQQAAIDAAQAAFSYAAELSQTVPSLTQTDAVAARSAEWLYQLTRDSRPAEAADWIKRAELAWRSQRQRTPFDVETLLALRNYPELLENHIGLLRDALRFGEAQGEWLASLARLAKVPQFEQALADAVAGSGPVTPQMDLDSLIASRAPEVQRLAAAWHGLRGEYDEAAAGAARAAEFYKPMRARFPKLQSVALAEEADYVFRGSAAEAPRAAGLLREAIAVLPVIQQQQYDEMVRPFRFRFALYLLATGEVGEAVKSVRAALDEQVADPELVQQMLQKLVHDVEAGGVPAEHLDRLRRQLCPEFPSFCQPASRRSE